ncbi:MAG: helix-turn-helix domain-containing protein [Pseudomonadota bacterium]
MDSLIAAAGRALTLGDALGALKHVALRSDPPALALRGIAMAQLGELALARSLLRRAARGFGSHEALAQARCVVAEAEVALAQRDLGGSPRTLVAAAAALAARADHANATHARLVAVRRLLLLGRVDEAAGMLAGVDAHRLATPLLAAVAALAAAEIALRSLQTLPARQALQRAQAAAARAGVPALQAEVAEAWAQLDRPAARRLQAGEDLPLRLAEVQALRASGALVVDACRRGLCCVQAWVSLKRRPLLFKLLLALAEAWPGGVDREALIAGVFRTRQPDETHRARLRVEIGRLRVLVAPLLRIEASARGFVLLPPAGQVVAVLLPPIDGEAAALQALLADGAAWSTSALALALGESQRTVQRALADLEAAGQVRSIGRARAQRWLSPPLSGFTTILLLPATLPSA